MVDFTDEDDRLFHLKLTKGRLEYQLKDCLGDMERWETKKKIEKIKVKIRELENKADNIKDTR